MQWSFQPLKVVWFTTERFSRQAMILDTFSFIVARVYFDNAVISVILYYFGKLFLWVC